MDHLVTISISHYCEKARWALQRAKLPFVEDGHLPIFHTRPVRRAGGQRSTPTLKTGQGTLTDSTDILRYVDTKRPGLLFPEQRAEVEALEDRFDLQLGPATRRVAYYHLLPHRSLVLRLIGVEVPRWEVWGLRLFYPIAVGMMRRGLKIDAAGAERSLKKAREIFEEVNSRLSDGRPYLCGNKFTAADLTFASLASPLLLPPEHPIFHPDPGILPEAFRSLVEELRSTPAGQHGLRMYREERAAVL